MKRMACLLGLVVLASSAWADTAAPAGPAAGAAVSDEQGYQDRLMSMDDSAASHVALAEWCAAHKMDDRAKVHWQEALDRDPDNAKARGALGFVRRGNEWVADTQAPAVAAAPRSPREAFRQRQAELARQIRGLATGTFAAQDPQARARGREQLLTIRESAAAEPIARILGNGDEQVRQFACEALGRIPGDEAALLLVKMLLKEESEPVRQAATRALGQRPDGCAVQPLLNALRGGDKARDRAAGALGEIGILGTAPALIDQLSATETRVLAAGGTGGNSSSASSGPGAYIFDGRIVAYIAGATPVVSENAVGWDPTVAAVPTGVVLDVRNVHVSIYRTVVVCVVGRPAVYDALKRLTGQDFGYDAKAWRDWLDKHHETGEAK